MIQLNLLDWTPRFGTEFDGTTFHRPRDGGRLQKQLTAVWKVLSDGRWYTLAQISELTDAPEASVSARCRDLRKPRNGSHAIEREYLGSGLWRYRMVGKAHD